MYAFLFCSRLSMLSQTKPLPLLLHTHNYAHTTHVYTEAICANMYM